MDIAYNVRTCRAIEAEKAERRGQYICPGCRGRVRLRRGTVRVPHFYHNPRTPDEQRRAESCQYFVFSQGGITPGFHAAWERRDQLPVAPSLAFRWRYRDGRLEWSLCIIIPEPPTSAQFDHVRVQGYVNGSDIARQVLNQTREFMVIARPGAYTVGGIRDDGFSSWNPDPTQPLAIDVPNVFGGGATGGVQLDADTPLFQGNNYAVLLFKNQPWKPPASVVTRPLDYSTYSDPKKQWQAHLFHIPNSADEEIEEWCVRSLDRRLLGRTPQLEVTAPPVMTMSLEGIYKVRVGSEIILSIRNETWWDPLIELHDFSKGTSQEFPLEKYPQFCSLGQLRPGRYGAYFLDRLDLDSFASLHFEVTTDATLTIPGVSLVSGAPGGALSSIDLLDATASSKWAEMVTGRNLLHRITLPPNWEVSLHWKPQKGHPEVRNKLNASAFLAMFNECLRSRPSYARLEAGLFGSVEWQATPPSPKDFGKRLPPALINRLRWLRSIRFATSAKIDRPLGIKIPNQCTERTAPADRELVAEFVATKTWPVLLLPHARSAALQLTRYLQPIEGECPPTA